MLKPSAIIDARAFIVAVSQQSQLPPELQTELHAIGVALQADENYLDRAIQRGVELISQYPELQAAYQAAGNNLQSGERSKGLPPKPIDQINPESSQEILNSVRNICLGADKQSQQPVGFLPRLFGRKNP
jgi:hypothetical protein